MTTPEARLRQRRSIRLKGYDYTQPGAYFVTMVTYRREMLFGEVVNSVMRLSPAGEIARREWARLAHRFCGIDVLDYVVMPNHVHGIIVISDSDRTGTAMDDMIPRIEDSRRAPTDMTERFGKPVAGSIPTIVRSYKSAVAYRINTLNATPGAAVWQRNYYEHIIRNETEWERIHTYIQANPTRWEADQLHPAAEKNRLNQDQP